MGSLPELQTKMEEYITFFIDYNLSGIFYMGGQGKFK
jgi:hypothetical protein